MEWILSLSFFVVIISKSHFLSSFTNHHCCNSIHAWYHFVLWLLHHFSHYNCCLRVSKYFVVTTKFYTLIHYVVITKDTSLIVTTIFSHQTHTLHSTCYGMHAKNKISSWFIRVIWNIAALWLALRPSSCSTRSSTMLLDLITISSNGHPLCLLLVSYRPITCNNCNELVIFGSEI